MSDPGSPYAGINRRLPSRRLELEGSWNFRDLGGYVGAGGRSVTWRRIFRADGLDRLTEADFVQVAALGLKTVVDLRTGDEVAKGKMAIGDRDVSWHHLPMLDVLPPRESYDTAWVGPDQVSERYVQMMASAGENVATFLTVIADETSYPLVYHCFAGKDRTGILTALVLGLLGVSDEDIAADYALSKLAMHRLLDWLRVQYGEDSAELESSAASIVAAEPETMVRFLDRFRSDFGSFDDYVAGIGQPGVGQRLRDLLLAG
jgi:protein tyrosine/serine phosphatase